MSTKYSDGVMHVCPGGAGQGPRENSCDGKMGAEHSEKREGRDTGLPAVSARCRGQEVAEQMALPSTETGGHLSGNWTSIALFGSYSSLRSVL